MALRGSKPRSALNTTIEEGETQDADLNFEAYDPVKWETATGQGTVDEAQDGSNVPEHEAVPETSGIPTFPNCSRFQRFRKGIWAQITAELPPRTRVCPCAQRLQDGYETLLPKRTYPARDKQSTT